MNNSIFQHTISLRKICKSKNNNCIQTIKKVEETPVTLNGREKL